jgi:hypothetical protein
VRVRAYISGALINAARLDDARRLYERLAEACVSAGWTAYVPHQHADPVRDPDLPNAEVARRDLAQVRAADVLVAYVGEPSLGVGAEVAIALAEGKRVLFVAGVRSESVAVSAGSGGALSVAVSGLTLHDGGRGRRLDYNATHSAAFSDAMIA